MMKKTVKITIEVDSEEKFIDQFELEDDSIQAFLQNIKEVIYHDFLNNDLLKPHRLGEEETLLNSEQKVVS